MTLSYQLDNPLRNELKPHERILWSGQPDAGRAAKRCIGLTIIGIPTAGLTGYFFYDIFQKEGFQFVLLILGLFFVLGLFLLIPGPLWAWLHAKRSVYAITSTRAIILHTTISGGVKTRFFAPQVLHETTRDESKNGCGDLIITHDIHTTTSRGGHKNTHKTPVGFMNIPDVRNVEQILLKMRDEYLRANPSPLPQKTLIFKKQKS